MNRVTEILVAVATGQAGATDELLPVVYEELRKLAAQKMARERPGQTLDATGLVHEAYLRLVGPTPAREWNGRSHFFAAAAEAMRRILVARELFDWRPTVGLNRTPFSPRHLAFTADGSSLVVPDPSAPVLHLLDLKRLNGELRDVSLEWEN